MKDREVSISEMKELKGGFKPQFQVSESRENPGRNIQNTAACEGPYVLGYCMDPVFTAHRC